MKEGWTYKKLGNFIKEYSARDKGQGFPVYSVTNTRGFCQEFFGKNVASADTSNYKVVPRGCFAYNPSRINVGSVACQDQEDNVSVSPLYVVFSVSPELRQDYLLYYIKSNYAMTYINALARGAVRNNLRLSTLKEFDIPFGPLDEQKRIVSELDLLSETIEKQKAQIEELDKLTQSIFYDMFGDPITNDKGWDMRDVESLCSNIVDCPHSTPQKSDIITAYPCIRTSELKEGEISWESMQYLDYSEYLIRIARLKPEAGDIVFGREGTIGNAVILPQGYNFCLGQRTMLLRVNTLINNRFLLWVILSEWIKKQITAVNVSSTVAHVNIKDFKKFMIPLPPLSLQQEFAAKVEAIEQMKAKVRQSLKESEELFNSRMDYYFN